MITIQSYIISNELKHWTKSITELEKLTMTAFGLELTSATN